MESSETSRPFDLYLTYKHLSEFWGVSNQAVIKYLRDSEISPQKVGKYYRVYPDDMQKIRLKRNLTQPGPKVFCTHVTKGGVGKTVITHALASLASMLGFRTLMIDLDMQGDLTKSFAMKSIPKKTRNILGVFNKEYSVEEAIYPITSHLDLIAADMSLTKFDVYLKSTDTNPQKLFERLLSPIIDQYDMVFIDCPPNLNAVTSAAKLYSDVLLMPTKLEEFSVENLEYSFDNLAALSDNYDVNCSPKIFLNMVDGRLTTYFDYFEKLKGAYGDMVCASYIGAATEIKKAMKLKKCIWEIKSTSPVFQDITNLFFEVTGLQDSWRSKRVQ